MLETSVFHKEVKDKDAVPVKVQNSFELLNDDNIVQKSIMESGTEPIIRFTGDLGFNQPSKRKEVSDLILDNQVGLCALIETHVAKGRVNNVFNRMFREWDWISNSDYCLKGCRIVIGWNPAVFDVLEIISSDQVIHCVVTDLETKTSFHCSVVYAANDHVIRRDLWHSLRSYSMLTMTSPWVVMGDFNAILDVSEAQGGVESRSPAVQEFKDCVNYIEVQDVVYSGIHFTWSGAPHGVGVVKKLDRVLANLDFLQKFTGAVSKFLPRGVSDHSPAIVDLKMVRRRGKSSFKFNNFLAYRENFLELVSDTWKKRVGGVKMFQITQKLHKLKKVFKAESWKGGDLSENGKILKAKLEDIQYHLDLSPLDDELRRQEQAVAREYRACKLEEERLFKQRAKVHWLKVGDQNSKFFHRSLLSRRHKKAVLEITNEDGCVIQGDDMNAHFVDFYKRLLGTKDECDKCVGLESVANKLNDQQASDLIRDSRGYLLQFKGSWDEFIREASTRWKGKSLHALINKLILAAVVFHIWLERNRRLFQQKRKQSGQIIAEIDDDIRRKLQGLQVVNSLRVREELSRWDVFIERPSIQS
ncbi:hypothetical protein DCAR_0309789 [Daucus carota subsp. sativus]|uniref:Endonuclease/exonuclease/phosphatase domain-containing protein n=1 Tax=Daucus carota subsp. sativus TaxID=79200 RepID=A0AAF0WIJ1_DAUCS|nr:hypothetical protein DCAR_0309789 [Daucus carota subsp. sativus]